MINLLSIERKAELRAARQNVALRSYVLLACMTLVLLAGLFGYAFLRTDAQQVAAQQQDAAALADLKQYDGVKEKAALYRANLAVAKLIMAGEFSFSDMLTQTGTAMAPNTIIENISLSTKSVTGQKKGAVTIEARAKSYADALQLKDALEKSELFSNVSAPNITRPDKTDGLEGISKTYLYSVKIEAIVVPLQGAVRGN